MYCYIKLSFGCCDTQISPFARLKKEFWFWAGSCSLSLRGRFSIRFLQRPKPSIVDRKPDHLVFFFFFFFKWQPEQVFLAKPWCFPNPNQMVFVPKLKQTQRCDERETERKNWTGTNIKLQQKETLSLNLSVVFQKRTLLTFIPAIGLQLNTIQPRQGRP